MHLEYTHASVNEYNDIHYNFHSFVDTTKQSQPPISRPRLISDPRPIPDPRPFPRPRPIPRPRTRETHSFLLVKNFPAAVYDEQSLIDYLEILTNKKCEDIQINNSMAAAVKMSEAIGKLQSL